MHQQNPETAQEIARLRTENKRLQTENLRLLNLLMEGDALRDKYIRACIEGGVSAETLCRHVSPSA